MSNTHKVITAVIVAVVLCGCSKPTTPTAPTVADAPKDKVYKPSELIALIDKLSGEEVIVEGQTISIKDMLKQSDERVMIVIEDRGIKTQFKDTMIAIIFESNGKEFSPAFLNWVKSMYDQRVVKVRGRFHVEGAPDDPKRKVFLTECEVIN